MSGIYTAFTKTFDQFFIPAFSHESSKFQEEKKNTLKIMEFAKPYFLVPYEDGGFWQKAARQINGTEYIVNRFNHGLAHGLRQGALSKDILKILMRMKTEYGTLDHPELNALTLWICAKSVSEKDFFHKVEFAASFQRSGRQSEGPSSADIEKYKRYEKQDAINFHKAASASNLFKDQQQIKIFEEAILWENKGTLSEELNPDLKYLRRILHTAHTFDLRRMPSFNAERMRKDGIKQLLGILESFQETAHCRQIQNAIWNRIGEYLDATGDRNLTHKSILDDKFFFQTANPIKMVNAICQIRESKIPI